ncbi:hypothetical protein B0H10DRAFT_2187998 [Mycena sp. CBHHK59/15]|nr:hypothetical protein B0H10DRAFT_2187998 [Mycena sp. CBHHK59/15]
MDHSLFGAVGEVELNAAQKAAIEQLFGGWDLSHEDNCLVFTQASGVQMQPTGPAAGIASPDESSDDDDDDAELTAWLDDIIRPSPVAEERDPESPEEDEFLSAELEAALSQLSSVAQEHDSQSGDEEEEDDVAFEAELRAELTQLTPVAEERATEVSDDGDYRDGDAAFAAQLGAELTQLTPVVEEHATEDYDDEDDDAALVAELESRLSQLPSVAEEHTASTSQRVVALSASHPHVPRQLAKTKPTHPGRPNNHKCLNPQRNHAGSKTQGKASSMTRQLWSLDRVLPRRNNGALPGIRLVCPSMLSSGVPPACTIIFIVEVFFADNRGFQVVELRMEIVPSEHWQPTVPLCVHRFHQRWPGGLGDPAAAIGVKRSRSLAFSEAEGTGPVPGPSAQRVRRDIQSADSAPHPLAIIPQPNVVPPVQPKLTITVIVANKGRLYNQRSFCCGIPPCSDTACPGIEGSEAGVKNHIKDSHADVNVAKDEGGAKVACAWAGCEKMVFPHRMPYHIVHDHMHSADYECSYCEATYLVPIHMLPPASAWGIVAVNIIVTIIPIIRPSCVKSKFNLD